MRPRACALAAALACAGSGFARLDPAIYGTHPGRLAEERMLHARAARHGISARAVAASAPDIGNITVMDASGGALAPEGVGPGMQPVSITIGGVKSNEIQIGVE